MGLMQIVTALLKSDEPEVRKPRVIACRRAGKDGVPVLPAYRHLLGRARNGTWIDVRCEKDVVNLQHAMRRLRATLPRRFGGLRLVQQKIGDAHWIVRLIPMNTTAAAVPNEPGFRAPRGNYREIVRRLVSGEAVECETRKKALGAQTAFWRLPVKKRANLQTRTTQFHGRFTIRAVPRDPTPATPKQPHTPNPYGRNRGEAWLRHVVTQMLLDRYAAPARAAAEGFASANG